MNLNDLQTPALVLDEIILKRNAATMTRRIAQRGGVFRPHMKTAKSIDAARVALDGNFGGITVSTLKEAEYFAAHGINDILLAVCMTPDKIKRSAALMKQGTALTLIIDSMEMAEALDTTGTELGVVFDVMVEIDSGEHRTGVDPQGKELPEIGRRLHTGSHTNMTGILTHAGHSYNCTGEAALRHIADQERAACVEAADYLRHNGVPCPRVSLGSTPTAVFATTAEGITETRAGVYMFGDLFQSDIGAHQLEDIALTVLTTVISHNRRHGRLVLDAGGLALSKDAGSGKHGYGLVADLEGKHLSNLHVANVYQEHGEVMGVTEEDFEKYPIGSRMRVLPNHACMTAAMYDGYHLVSGPSTEIKAWWPRTNGWTPGGA